MPFKSEKQRRYLWANEPKVAQKWADEEKKKGKHKKHKRTVPKADKNGYY